MLKILKVLEEREDVSMVEDIEHLKLQIMTIELLITTPKNVRSWVN